MRDLTLIVTDLWLPPRQGEPAPAARSLPSLELLIARAASITPGDWRAWVLQRFELVPGAIVDFASLPVAAISRYAHSSDVPGDWWLATPVHLSIALDHVRLAQVLSLTEGEWEQIRRGYREVFPDERFQLEAAAGASAYLRSREPLNALTSDPSRSIGSDVHDALPRGPDAPHLKRLMTELQMWLHEHELNRTRVAAEELEVNGLWIWGGGSLPVVPTGVRLPKLHADDDFLRGLWRLAGAESSPLTPALEAGMIALANEPVSVLVGVALRALPGGSDGERLQALERLWLKPALDALQTGALREFRVHLNDRLYRLRRGDLLRFWRRRRPWTEALS